LTSVGVESMIAGRSASRMSEATNRAGAPSANVGPGAILGGRFRLESPLGEGGMAEVWRAFDLSAQRMVAVKVLRPQVAISAEAVQRLKREGEVMSALSHPGIVRVETYGQLEGGVVFLAMELLDGETLGARMRRGRMEPGELAPIVAGTCAALAAAHAKAIVHRDLKPDNIFLMRAPGPSEPSVKLLDFGISKVYGGDKLTYTGEVLGTPRYMSPEQLSADPDVDGRVDIYALGVILYEALAGKPPFLAASVTDLIIAIVNAKIVPLRAHRPDVQPALEAVILRSMARAREARYTTAIELADAFLEASGALASARGGPKVPALRTQALGGAGYVVGSIPPAPDPQRASLEPEASIAARNGAGDALRPGTFSELGAVDHAEAARRGTELAFASTALAPGVGSAVVTPPGASGPSTRMERPHAKQALASAAEIAAPSPSYGALSPPAGYAGLSPPVGYAGPDLSAGSGSWNVGAAELGAPPAGEGSSTGAKIALVLGGLIAGAISAGIAIAAMHHFGSQGQHGSAGSGAQGDHGTASATSTGSEATAGAGPASADGVAVTDDAGGAAGTVSAPGDTTTEAEAEPPAEEAGEADSTRERPHRRERSRRGERAAAGAESADEAAAPATPLELAQRALAGGDAEECVSILDDLIAHGATPIALRRRADCLLRAGRREAALEDYRRFCRIAPDHPSAGTVRELLAGMGLSCP
jgi:hypothetical protein